MPPRLSKRQQREQAELEALSGTLAQSDQVQEEGSTSAKSSVFVALMERHKDESDVSEDESGTAAKKAKKPKKKKKRASEKTIRVDGAAQEEPTLPSSSVVEQSAKAAAKEESTSTPTKQEKKALKKERRKAAAKGDEDIDFLEQLSTTRNYNSYLPSSSKVPISHTPVVASPAVAAQNTLLTVSTQHLDSDMEMRKFFGSKIIDSVQNQPRPTSQGRRSVRTQPTKVKSVLTKPTSEWWPASMREGLSCRGLTPDELLDKKMSADSDEVVQNGEKWFTVEYAKKYRSVTKAFLEAVMSGDPERLYRVLGKLPYHADTLLQLADIYRHQEEHSRNADFLSRALFAYERAFVGTSLASFSTGDSRLDFDRVENRPFYLAVARTVVDLQRRGTIRASFEFARLLLSLDPHTDPHGSLFNLDYLALKAGMERWLIDLWDVHDSWAKEDKLEERKERLGRFNVTALPGWAYARALALRALEEQPGKKLSNDSKRESDVALRDAILSFPSFVPLIADKAEISLPAKIRGHAKFKIFPDGTYFTSHSDKTLHLLSHLYAHRSGPIWKIPSNASWFSSTVSSLTDYDLDHAKASRLLRARFDAVFPYHSASNSILSCSIYRHIFVSLGAQSPPTAQQLAQSFFPASVRLTPYLSCDPLPPEKAKTNYDDLFFSGLGADDDVFGAGRRRGLTRREREAEDRMLARLVPDREIREQLRVAFNAHPEIQDRFPGGILQFAQVAAELPEDFWDDVLMAAQNLNAAGDGGREMPGGMLDLEFVDGDQEPMHIQVEGIEADDHLRRQAHVEDDEEEEEGEDSGVDSDDSEDQPPLPTRLLRTFINRFWGGAAPAAVSESDSEEAAGIVGDDDDVESVD